MKNFYITYQTSTLGKYGKLIYQKGSDEVIGENYISVLEWQAKQEHVEILEVIVTEL